MLVKFDTQAYIFLSIAANVMSSNFSAVAIGPTTVTTTTSTGSDSSLGVIIGASVGGILFIILAVVAWFHFNDLKLYTSKLCGGTLEDQV
jgi:hypothetical protein